MSPTDHPKGAAGLRAHDVKPQEPAKGSAARAGGFAGSFAGAGAGSASAVFGGSAAFGSDGVSPSAFTVSRSAARLPGCPVATAKPPA